jgi:tetratricopeptide (TPR) repeat protein
VARAFRDGGLEAGLAAFDELKAGQPDVVTEAFTTGVAAGIEGMGERDAAIALLERNAELNPRSANAQDALAEMLLNGGDYREALEAYGRALELNPKHQGAARGKAWLEPVLAALDDPPTVRLALLERYHGDYGPRHITLEARGLLYQRDGNPSYRLRPMSDDTFFLEGLGSFRIRFATDQTGRVTKIVGLYFDGNEDESRRDP